MITNKSQRHLSREIANGIHFIILKKRDRDIFTWRGAGSATWPAHASLSEGRVSSSSGPPLPVPLSLPLQPPETMRGPWGEQDCCEHTPWVQPPPSDPLEPDPPQRGFAAGAGELSTHPRVSGRAPRASLGTRAPIWSDATASQTLRCALRPGDGTMDQDPCKQNASGLFVTLFEEFKGEISNVFQK